MNKLTRFPKEVRERAIRMVLEHTEEYGSQWAAIIKDIWTMLRDEDFMTRLWAKANELLASEKPGLKKELARVDGQIVKARAKIDLYFEAFEARTMKPHLYNQ